MKVQQIVNKVNVDVARLVLVIAAAATAARTKNSLFLSFMFLPLSLYFLAMANENHHASICAHKGFTTHWFRRSNNQHTRREGKRTQRWWNKSNATSNWNIHLGAVARNETERNSEICTHEKRNETNRHVLIVSTEEKRKAKDKKYC